MGKVSGGSVNAALAEASSVSGGKWCGTNVNAIWSSVSGGYQRWVNNGFNWQSGSLLEST